MRNIAMLALLLSATAFIAGCGGGGGGGDAPPPPPATYSLSGDVAVPSQVVTDGDVNDLETSVVHNDTSGTAQTIPNPSMVLGYANVAGGGPAGASSVTGDIEDVYKVRLTAGQVVEMAIGHYQVADLDLYLINETGTTVVDASEQAGSQYEAVTAPSDGVYLVVVSAFSGGSNYSMTVGATTAASYMPEDDFMPGEIILQMKPSETPAAARTASFAVATGLNKLAGQADRPMLMGFANDAEQGRTFAALGLDKKPLNFARLDAKTAKKKATMEVVRELRKRSEVLNADLNYIRTIATTPNDQYYPLQWHYPLINIPQAWDTANGSGVVVAVVDTGVDLQHPDLSGQLLPGYDFIRNLTSSKDGDGIDVNADDPGDRNSPTGESSFHGTHVTGTIGALTNNSIGVSGVAFGAKIIPVRVLGALGGESYDIIQGVKYAAGLANDSGTVPANPAKIINLSIQGYSFSQTEQNAYSEVRSAGAVVIAAAGNYDISSPSYPASYSGVVSVAAVNSSATKASYSNYGTAIDVAAPGGEYFDSNGDSWPDGILSTVSHDNGATDYWFMPGTSMASPHVAGVAALMKQAWPAMTPSDFDALLANGAITWDLGAAGRDDIYGHGLINAAAAVAAAAEMASVTIPANLVVSPASLSFGVTGTTASIACSNSGNVAALTITSVTDNASWLTVTQGAAVGMYTATVSRASLANGSYSATITFTSTANTVTVPVTMIVDSTYDSGAKSVGTVWLGVSLYSDIIDGGDITIYVDPYALSTGTNAYDLLDVEAGQYVLFAGTDIDNDGELGDDHELFGAYPLLESPAILDVTANQSGLNFSIAPVMSIGSAAASSGEKTRYHLIRGRP